MPFRFEIPEASGEWSMPFDTGVQTYADWALPFDLSGAASGSWELPFAILDATVGEEGGSVLSPLIGFYDPAPPTVLTYRQIVWETPGIVGLWMLGDDDPLVASDALGIHHGVAGDPIVGSVPGFLVGYPDRATPFSAVEAIVVTPLTSPPLWAWGTGDFTVEWIMRTETWDPDGMVVSPETTPDWSVRTDATTDVLGALVGTGPTVDILSGSGIKQDGYPHHIALVVNRDTVGQWYLDGIADGAATNISAIASHSLTASGDLVIGAGLVAEIMALALYSVPLTPAQVAAHSAAAGYA